jgi:hypothetical protein
VLCDNCPWQFHIWSTGGFYRLSGRNEVDGAGWLQQFVVVVPVEMITEVVSGYLSFEPQTEEHRDEIVIFSSGQQSHPVAYVVYNPDRRRIDISRDF